jgi:membrane protein
MSRVVRLTVPPVRELIRDVMRAYDDNDLLTFASAIAFQVLFALLPFALFAIGLLGAFGLTEVWRHDVAPELKQSVSPAAFQLLNSTALKVLGSQNVFWITAGLVISAWEMSSAMRAVMDVFDRIYEVGRKRSLKERYVVSVVLAVVVGGLLLMATAVFMLGPLTGTFLTVARWPLSVVLLLAAIAAQLRFAPAEPQPVRWVSMGTVLVIVAWLITSLAFAFYIRDIADYGTVYGGLASAFIAFEYIYLAVAAFVTGAQIDRLVRERARADMAGVA